MEGNILLYTVCGIKPRCKQNVLGPQALQNSTMCIHFHLAKSRQPNKGNVGPGHEIAIGAARPRPKPASCAYVQGTACA